MTDEQRKRVHIITYSTDDRMELAERIVSLEDEKAKLRKFIIHIWPVVWTPSKWCYRCPHVYECVETDEEGGFVRMGCNWRDDLERMARELGIEEDV